MNETATKELQNDETLHAPLTPPQKAAIILVSMGQDYAAPIIEKLEDNHLRSFIRALEQLPEVPRKDLLAAIADFITILERRKDSFRAGPDRARGIAEDLLNSERVSRLLGTVPEPTKAKSFSEDSVWGRLNQRSAESIADFVLTQRIEIATLILSELPTEKAGDVLSEIPEEQSIPYIARLSDTQMIAPHAKAAVAELVEQEFLTSASKGGAGGAAIEFVSGLLSALSKDKRNLVMEGLDKTDPEKAQKIRAGMLVFEDLATRLPPTAVQIIFKEVEKSTLLTALKAGGDDSPASVEFLFGNISQRMAEQMKEEIADMKPLTGKEGDKALSELMGFVSRLEKSDRITLLAKPVEDEAAA